MAEINFGLLDTQLPGRIATIPLQAQEAGQANALRTMQMMQGMSQNRLSDLNYNEQMRGIEEQKQIRSALSGIDVTTPQGQNEAVSRATRINPKTGFELAKFFGDEQKRQADIAYTRAQTGNIGFEQGVKNKTQAEQILREASLNPTDEVITAAYQKAVSLGVPMQEAMAKLQRTLAQSPQERSATLSGHGITASDARKQFTPEFRAFGGDMFNIAPGAVDPVTGMPKKVGALTAAPSTAAAMLSARAGAMKWNPETLQFESVVPGGMSTRPAPINAMIPRPATAPAPAVTGTSTTYSSRMLREMAAKGMQPDGKGGQTFIPGGEKDPAAILRIETAKAEGAATGKDMVAAVRTLPNAIASSQKALANIDAMLGDAKVEGNEIVKKGKPPHPGFENAVGTGIGLRFIPGTDASDFQERFREVTSGAFLEAFESLRGGGSITEKEGEKATAAKTRMSLAQSETEFVTAAREYQEIIRVGIGRAQERLRAAQGASASAGNTGGGAPINIQSAAQAEIARRANAKR